VFVAVATVRAVFAVVVGPGGGVEAGVVPPGPAGAGADVPSSGPPDVGTGVDAAHVAAHVQVQAQFTGVVPPGPAPCLESERSVPQTVKFQAQSQPPFEGVAVLLVSGKDVSVEVVSAGDGLSVGVADPEGAPATDVDPFGASAWAGPMAGEATSFEEEEGGTPALFAELSQIQFHDQSQSQLDAL
jgi:hypothetical protein